MLKKSLRYLLLLSIVIVPATFLLAQEKEAVQENLENMNETIAEMKKELISLRSITAQNSKQMNANTVGKEIYQTACKACHGINGDGKGHGGKRLNPKPRDFRKGLYKWRTTGFDSLPTDEDLDRTIREGVPGTEMVPFGRLISKKNRAAVISYIQSFSPRFREKAENPEVEKVVLNRVERETPASYLSVTKGKKLFNKYSCYVCHGLSGDGQGIMEEHLVDSWGDSIQAWDFTKGYFKSGIYDFDLFRSISTGLSGTPMPAFSSIISAEERWQLVDYIKELGKKKKGFLYWLLSEEPTGVVYSKTSNLRVQSQTPLQPINKDE